MSCLVLRRLPGQSFILKIPLLDGTSSIIRIRLEEERKVVIFAPESIKVLREELNEDEPEKPIPLQKEFENHVQAIMDRMVSTWIPKQKGYGPSNIGIFREMGIMVRMIDKISRVHNILMRGGEEGDESLKDNFLDIAVYCAIALMCMEKEWPIFTLEELKGNMNNVREVQNDSDRPSLADEEDAPKGKRETR